MAEILLQLDFLNNRTDSNIERCQKIRKLCNASNILNRKTNSHREEVLPMLRIRTYSTHQVVQDPYPTFSQIIPDPAEKD